MTSREPPDDRRWLTRLLTTLAAWLVAFLVVLGLFTVLGEQLEALPHALDALLFTGVLVPVMGNLVMPVLSVAIARWVAGLTPRRRTPPPEHPELAALPDWPTQTVGLLSTLDGVPYAIPVSAPLRAGNRRVLLSLHRGRGSLARLRRCPDVALAILAEGDIAFTARGHARVVQAPLAGAPAYVAVAIDVQHIDDHRQAEFRVESGIDRRWVDEEEQGALRWRVQALEELAPSGA